MSRTRRGAVSKRPGSTPIGREGLRTIALVLAGSLFVAVVVGVFALGTRTWSPPAIAPGAVVARVHGEPVTWAAVAVQLKAAEVMGRPRLQNLATWRTAVQATVDSIVGDVLTRHYMEGQGVTVTDEMIDAEVRKVQERYGGEAGFARGMDEMKVSMAEFRETQRRGLYLQALSDRIAPASDADIDAYLAQPGAAGLSRADAASRVRSERPVEGIPEFLAELRRDPGIWVIDVTSLS